MLRKISDALKIAGDYSSVKKDKQYIYDNVMDQVVDLIGDKEIKDTLDAESSTIGKSWLVYHSVGNDYFAKNVKRRGIPDYDDVIKALAVKTKMDPKNIQKIITPNFFEDLFHDDVNFVVDNFGEIIDDEVSILGRSGGYWGVKISSEIVGVDDKALKSTIDKALSQFAFKYRGLDEVDPDDVVEDIMGLLEKVGISDYMKIDPKWEKNLKELDKAIESTIKDFESSKKWVEMIISNKYLEN